MIFKIIVAALLKNMYPKLITKKKKREIHRPLRKQAVLSQHAVRCVQRCPCVPDAYIQRCTAHTERLNISMLISTGRRETDALAFNSWNEGRLKIHTVPVCLSAVFGAVVAVALIGQTVWVSTLMQCCHLLK